MRHQGWKLLGYGIIYAAYLVGDEVIKVPKAYFSEVWQNSHPYRQIEQIIEEADFVIPPAGSPMRLNWVKQALRAERIALQYGEFGVRTMADNEGLIHQEYVPGERPPYEEEPKLRHILKEKGMSTNEAHLNINFRITPTGYKIFDYSNERIKRRKHGSS